MNIIGLAGRAKHLGQAVKAKNGKYGVTIYTDGSMRVVGYEGEEIPLPSEFTNDNWAVTNFTFQQILVSPGTYKSTDGKLTVYVHSFSHVAFRGEFSFQDLPTTDFVKE